MFAIFTSLHNYYNNLTLERLYPLKKNPLTVTPLQSPSPPNPRWPLIYFLSLDLAILGISYKRNHTMCGLFCDWLLSLRVFSRSIHAVACISPTFLLTAKRYSMVWIDHVPFTHISVDGHFSCFHFWLLWIKLLWHCMCKLLCECMCLFFLGICLEVEFLTHKVTLNIFRNRQTASQRSCTIISHPHQQWMRVPISPHPLKHLLLSVVFLL